MGVQILVLSLMISDRTFREHYARLRTSTATQHVWENDIGKWHSNGQGSRRAKWPQGPNQKKEGPQDPNEGREGPLEGPMGPGPKWRKGKTLGPRAQMKEVRALEKDFVSPGIPPGSPMQKCNDSNCAFPNTSFFVQVRSRR